MTIHGKAHHFSVDALALFQQEAKREPFVLPCPPKLAELIARMSEGGSLTKQWAKAHQDTDGAYQNTNVTETSKNCRSTEQLYSSINTLACIYALARIAHTYRSHFVANVHPTTWYDNLIPLRNTALVKKIRFGIAVTLILGETLLGKSLAKLLILCATGDMSDLIEAMVTRVKRIVIG